MTSSKAELKLTRSPVAGSAASAPLEASPHHACNGTRKKPKKEPKATPEPQVCSVQEPVREDMARTAPSVASTDLLSSGILSRAKQLGVGVRALLPTDLQCHPWAGGLLGGHNPGQHPSLVSHLPALRGSRGTATHHGKSHQGARAAGGPTRLSELWCGSSTSLALIFISL